MSWLTEPPNPVLPTGVLGRLPQARRDPHGPGRSGPEARGGGRSGDAGGEGPKGGGLDEEGRRVDHNPLEVAAGSLVPSCWTMPCGTIRSRWGGPLVGAGQGIGRASAPRWPRTGHMLLPRISPVRTPRRRPKLSRQRNVALWRCRPTLAICGVLLAWSGSPGGVRADRHRREQCRGDTPRRISPRLPARAMRAPPMRPMRQARGR